MSIVDRSPAWRNPREPIRRKVRKSSSRCLITAYASSPTTSMADLNTESAPPLIDTSSPVVGLTRNPFKRGSPVKKKKKMPDVPPPDWDDETANDPFNSSLSRKFVQHKSFLSEYALDFSSLDSSSIPQKAKTVVEEKTATELPIDARLGTKLRLISDKKFPWMQNFKNTGNVPVRITGKDTHDGTKMAVNGLMTNMSMLTPPVDCSNGYTPSSIIYAASLYWQYPDLPWLPLFPRLDSLVKHMPKPDAPPLAQRMLEDINAVWTDSFEQLFLSWKKGERHSFYVCCSSFTALFTRRKEELSPTEESQSCFNTIDGNKHVVILTPTTSGFRQFLRNEGVQLEPYLDGKRRISRSHSILRGDDESSQLSMGDSSRIADDVTQSQPPIFFVGENKENEDSSSGSRSREEIQKLCTPEKEKGSSSEEDFTSPTKESDAHSWLKGIGVSPATTLKMKRNASSHARLSSGSTGSAGGDTASNVAAIVKDTQSVQALFNVILTSKACRAIAGPHAGLPPTLLAAQPFYKGALQSLKKTSQILKRVGRSVEYVMEMEGPILPHTTAWTCSFIRSCEMVSRIRVNDRSSCPGMNGVVDGAIEWNEINVDKELFRWKER